jgi:hypothetical protein
MKRPIGLILSAIVLSLAALFLLLMTALMAFAGIFAKHQPSIAAATHFVTYFMLAFSGFYAALAVWAILTVIGILRLRSWARYSILIIGGGLAVFNVFGIIGALIGRTMLPTLQAQQPTADPHIMSAVFLVMAAINLLFAAVGIWWLIYFNLRSTREIFSNPATLILSSANVSGSFSRTPTAIKIIGGFLLFSAICCLFCAFLPFPAFFLGFILPPAQTHILYLCFAALTGWMGYGLLRLKESARLMTIAFQFLGCANIALASLPWYQARFRLYMTQIASYIPTVPGQPQIVFRYTTSLVIFALIWGLIIYGIVIWLLHRHRTAFRAPAPPAESMLEA